MTDTPKTPAPGSGADETPKSGLLGFAHVDLERQRRRGRAETIFCQGKTADQIAGIAREMAGAGQNVLMTRADDAIRATVAATLREDYDVEVNDLGRTIFARVAPIPQKKGLVGIISAGTSDIPVAEEAAVTCESFGSPVRRIYDVGVAGLHRLLSNLEEIHRLRVVVVTAGMEGALPSVVGGLVKAPVIAVPTSVGYGASFQGLAALLGMLNTCSPGVCTMNIDNGFGAGYLADVINAIGEGAGAGGEETENSR